MCLQHLQWHPLNNKLFWTERECLAELRAHDELHGCRCERYLTVLPQSGDQ
jgi:hypothetical protein